MPPSRLINFFAIFLLGLTLSLVIYNPLASQPTYTCPAPQTIGGHLCRGKVPKPLPEEAWGQVGGVAYQAAEKWMVANNVRYQGLDETQKRYLRPYFGDLVDRVAVSYKARLLDEWVAASFRINVSNSNAQVYGHKIYIKNLYQHGDLDQIVLLAHELVHCQQYEKLGSIVNFGYHYFKEYKRAGENYRKNKFEQEAFKFEADFAKVLSAEIAQYSAS